MTAENKQGQQTDQTQAQADKIEVPGEVAGNKPKIDENQGDGDKQKTE